MPTGNKITWSVAGIVGFIVAFVQLPQVSAFLSSFLAAHPQLSVAVAGLGTIIALFHNPTPNPPAGS